MNDNVKNIDKKVAVTHAKVEDTNDRIVELQRQLTRMEDKLDKRGSR
jgi:peptidoglycan hydrolase CwlO-like protein